MAKRWPAQSSKKKVVRLNCREFPKSVLAAQPRVHSLCSLWPRGHWISINMIWKCFESASLHLALISASNIFPPTSWPLVWKDSSLKAACSCLIPGLNDTTASGKNWPHTFGFLISCNTGQLIIKAWKTEDTELESGRRATISTEVANFEKTWGTH